MNGRTRIQTQMVWQNLYSSLIAWFLLHFQVIPVTWVESISQLHHGNSLLCYFSLFTLRSLPTLLSSNCSKSIVLHGSSLLYCLHTSSLFSLNTFHFYTFSAWWYIPLYCLVPTHPTNHWWGFTYAKWYSGTSEYGCLSWSLHSS